MERASGPEIAGRDRERALLGQFVDGVGSGLSVAALQGDAGSGKTTLWEHALGLLSQKGAQILIARPVATEAALSFSGLRDLFDPVLDHVAADLPAPLRTALEVALLRREPETAIDPGAIGLGCLRSLQLLALDVPVIVAIDDLQWLDAASASALAFALRRAHSSLVAALVTHRAGLGLPLDLADLLGRARVSTLTLGPLNTSTVRQLLRKHFGELSGVTARRLALLSQGNPMYALELGRAELATGTAVDHPTSGTIPPSLRALLGSRCAALPPATRRTLAALSLSADATEATLSAVLPGVRVGAALRKGVAAGVVWFDRDHVRFCHPLLAAAASEELSPAERRDLHGRLAGVVGSSEERVRHLALGASGPDAATALAAESEARAALARGAPEAGAELAELAQALTPVTDVDQRERRASVEAACAFAAGDSARALRLLTKVTQAPSPAARIPAVALLGRVLMFAGDLTRAIECFATVLQEEERSATIEVDTREGLAWCHLLRWTDVRPAMTHARHAAALAATLGDADRQAEAQAVEGLARVLAGQREGIARLRAAAGTVTSEAFPRVMQQPEFALAIALAWCQELDEARGIFARLLECCVERGDEVSRPRVLFGMAYVALHSGRWDEARLLAAEAGDAAALADQAPFFGLLLISETLVRAYHGTLNADDLPSRPGEIPAVIDRWAAGLQALSAGDHGGAHRHLTPLVAQLERAGIGEPGALAPATDAVESLVGLGRLDDAATMLEGYESRCRRAGRELAYHRTRRCRALLAAARPDPGAAAIELAEAAVTGAPDRLSEFERARDLLVAGTIARRVKQKRRSRERLDEAVSVFESLRADGWAARARDERARIGGRTVTGGLTVAERRVAELVADGLTNRQVAAQLFVTEKTVEANLSRAFAKLGIRTRGAVARRLAGEPRVPD